MSLLAMNSLYEIMGNDGYLWSKNKRLTPCATRTIIFQRKFKLFNSLYHSVHLVFSTLFFVFYCQYVQPCVICGKQCNETSRQVTMDRISNKKQYVQPCVICGKQCNETSRQVTMDRISNKKHMLAKQNCYLRQSRWFDG